MYIKTVTNAFVRMHEQYEIMETYDCSISLLYTASISNYSVTFDIVTLSFISKIFQYQSKSVLNHKLHSGYVMFLSMTLNEPEVSNYAHRNTSTIS